MKKVDFDRKIDGFVVGTSNYYAGHKLTYGDGLSGKLQTNEVAEQLRKVAKDVVHDFGVKRGGASLVRSTLNQTQTERFNSAKNAQNQKIKNAESRGFIPS